jgi:GT2 family glycosyltransferase
MVVRTEAVDQIGLLDESFFLYGEDIEWCSRMRSGGWRIGACSTVTMRHSAGSSAQRTLGEEDRLRRLARAELDVVKRERGTTSARLYGAVTMFGLALESVHPRRRPAERERARSFSRAYRAALRRPQLLARSRDA